MLLVLLASAINLSAYSSLNSLDIRVVLSRNGDAHITETRKMDIGWEGTECYIVIGNLEGSQIRDFMVKDETGHRYEYEELVNVVSTKPPTGMSSAGVWANKGTAHISHRILLPIW